MVVDLDLKHEPPEEIKRELEEGCEAIERTPGGYHYWFVYEERVSHLRNKTEMWWEGKEIAGLDVRSKGGICYVCPTSYVTSTGERKKYVWYKGDLSKATAMPSGILERLSNGPQENGQETRRKGEMASVLEGLSNARADSYSQWITAGMALKNDGYECSVWDDWSRQSRKYREGECAKRWSSFGEREKRVTTATLYHWLKEDNYELFCKIKSKNKGIEANLVSGTHAMVADAFYEMNPRSYLFVQEEGWFVLQENNVWNGTGGTDIQSIPDILNQIRDSCGDVLEAMIGGLDRSTDEGQTRHGLIRRAVLQINNVTFLRGVASLLKGLYYHKGPIKFNEKRQLFAFTNGVMDFSSRPWMFREIEPEDYITVTCGYDYRPARAEEKHMVHEVIKKIFPLNGVLQYVLGALSRTFVGSNSGQWFHVFTGMGANGKSLLMELCKMVFGGYYQTFSVTYLTKESDGMDRPLPELASARYARMLVTSEPDERDKFQVSIIKNLTGTENVTFRGMFAKKVIPYVPQFQLWVLSNDLPRLSKYDHAIERRMRLVHFRTRFVYEPHAENEALRDDTLTRRFREEEGWCYGLLGLLLDAYSEEPLEMPQEVRDATDAYMLENNPVGAWLRQHYEITGRREDMIQKTELYRAFLEDTAIQKTQKAFSEDMVKSSINERRVDNVRYYYGIVQKVEPEN